MPELRFLGGNMTAFRITRRALIGALPSLAPLVSRAQTSDPTSIAEIYNAAKREGKVVHWGSPDTRTAKDLRAKFRSRYPGVDVEIFKIEPAPAMERTVMAAMAGRIEADTIDSTLGTLPILFDRSLVVPFDWTKTFGISPDRVLYDGKAVVSWHLDFPIAYNSGLSESTTIKSWDDLLQPRWSGKVIVEARGIAFAVLAAKWGEDRTLKFIDDLMANKPVITKGSTATIEALAGGQGVFAVGAYGGLLEKAIERGAPVSWFPVSPIPASIAAVVSIKNSPHPNAALLWIAFLTSQTGQDILDEDYGLSITKGPVVGTMGKKYARAGLDVITESNDITWTRKMLQKVSAKIGGIG